MKKKDFTELKGKTIKELSKLASDKKLESIKKKMDILSGKEKNLKLHRQIRAEVAKILTLIHEKEILEKLTPKVEVEVKGESKKESKGKGKEE